MEKIKVSNQELIKAVAGVTGDSQRKVKELLGAAEAVIKAQVAKATEDASVEIKVFNGLTIVSEYVAPREARNPMTGETFIAEAKNRVKAKIGSSLKEAANA